MKLATAIYAIDKVMKNVVNALGDLINLYKTI